MAAKKETVTETAPEATEPKKERKPKDVQYHTVRVVTFRAHKSVGDRFPDIVPGIVAWAEKAGLVAESETITTTQKTGKKTAKGEALKFPKVEITFDTKDSYANRKSSTAGVSRELVGAMRQLVNDEAVIAKAKASGMTVDEMVKKALANLK